jgi:hypothetical protein
VFDIVLTSAERALLEVLTALGSDLFVSMRADLIEGAPGAPSTVGRRARRWPRARHLAAAGATPPFVS